MGHYESSAKRKVHSTKCPIKENGESTHWRLNSTPESSGKKEADSPMRNRRLEIIKLRAEINKIETQKTIQRINETKSWFLEKINKIDKPLSKLIKWQRENMHIYLFFFPADIFINRSSTSPNLQLEFHLIPMPSHEQ